MNYKYKNSNRHYTTYNININKNKLSEILKQLENYQYIKYNIGFTRSNNINLSKEEIIKKVRASFNFLYKNPSNQLVLNSIGALKTPEELQISYEYQHKQYPELYNIIIKLLSDITPKDFQYTIQSLLDYSKSQELIPYEKREIPKIDNSNDEFLSEIKKSMILIPYNDLGSEEEREQIINKNYDFSSLNKLYLETLKSITFIPTLNEEESLTGEVFSKLKH